MSKSVSQWIDRVAARIVDTAIALLERSPSGADFASAGVDNLWEECCLKLNGRRQLASADGTGPFHNALREILISVDRDDLLDLWLRTAKGRKFLSMSKGKSARAPTLPPDAIEQVAAFLLTFVVRRAEEYDSDSLLRYQRGLRKKEDERNHRQFSASRQRHPETVSPKLDEPAESYFDRLVLMLITGVRECRPENGGDCQEVSNSLGKIALPIDLYAVEEDIRDIATAMAKDLSLRAPVRGVIAIWLMTSEGQIWKTSSACSDRKAPDLDSLRHSVAECLTDAVMNAMKSRSILGDQARSTKILSTQNAPLLQATFDMSKEDFFVVKVATSIANKLLNRRLTSFDDALMLGTCISAMRRLPSRTNEADFALEIYSNRNRASILFRLSKSSFEIVRRRVGLSAATLDSWSEVLVWRFGNDGERYRAESPYGLRAEVEWLWSGEERFRVQIS